ncbi:MAG: phosphate signaling complex protein PhoU [Bacteroidota bacterium]|nr:phosphate signaling complex protein PhoU [Bacteroidota bacterium]
MQENFVKETESLKENLIKMASLVDQQVEQATLALETGNIELCKGIKAKDKEIDAYDNLINTQCENILALFQPVAIDLRFIISTLLINNQLERCGDIAVNIAQRVKKTKDFRELIIESRIIEMGKQARLMVQDAIDSFINGNTEKAHAVLEADEVVDTLNKEVFDFLVEKMQADSRLIEGGSHLIVLTKHIERLADHSTNIAENLVFYVDAEFISHKKKILTVSGANI